MSTDATVSCSEPRRQARYSCCSNQFIKILQKELLSIRCDAMLMQQLLHVSAQQKATPCKLLQLIVFALVHKERLLCQPQGISMLFLQG